MRNGQKQNERERTEFADIKNELVGVIEKHINNNENNFFEIRIKVHDRTIHIEVTNKYRTTV